MSDVIFKRKEVAIYLYSFLKEKCVSRKNHSFPSLLKPRTMAKEIFKSMHPEFKKDFRSTLVYPHSEKIISISTSISSILSICGSEKQSRNYLIDKKVMKNLKRYNKIKKGG